MTPPRRARNDEGAGDDLHTPSTSDVITAFIGSASKNFLRVDERLTAHEILCNQREKDATTHRHDFRAEVALKLGELRQSVDDIGRRLDKGLAQIEARVEEKIDELEKDVSVAREGLAQSRDRATALVTRVLTILLALVGSAALYLLMDKLGL